ncbi:MAG: ABC transporter permease, partial [Eubacteriales bacterium]
MQVFKAYFKIVNKRKSALLIYFMIFIIISIVITSQLGGASTQSFSQTKSSIAFYNAENTPLVDGLKSFLAKNAVLVNIPDNEDDIQDALFYNKVSYVLRVPQGFTDSFIQGNNTVTLQKRVVPSSQSEGFVAFL